MSDLGSNSSDSTTHRSAAHRANGSAGAPAIRISNVTKRFGTHTAVRDLDLVVPRGSLCGFLGPNGAGKSTTIRMILSIIYPDSGSIEVNGGSALAQKDTIGYLPEERGVYKKMRVGDFLHYIASLKGVPACERATRVTHWLKRMELADVENKKCQELSKGMQQKIQFIAAVIHEPELLILDEPFSGLDPVNAQLLVDLLRELNHAGTTIIFSTHVLHQAEQICDRIFLINKGNKLLDASLAEIYERFDPRTIVLEPMNGSTITGPIPGVSNVRQRESNPGYELELEEGADAQDVMRRTLEKHAVRSIALRRVSLDEVFVRLVLEDRGAEAAAIAREELSLV